MITEIPSGMMKWIGGGHDPLGDGAGREGSGFVAGVLNRGEGALQASGGAFRGLSGKGKEIGKTPADKAAANTANGDHMPTPSAGGGKTATISEQRGPTV